ncbi:hypothetical protein IT397_01140 [Candidatus Nomurabacteria bacterium]|nr:hypothetical protein [Candidatus Nomurabacteria bacterium]
MARNRYRRSWLERFSAYLNVGLVTVLIIAFIVVTIGAINEKNIPLIAFLFTILGGETALGVRRLAEKMDQAAANRRQARLARISEEQGY